MYKKFMSAPPPGRDVVHLVTHGGLGDILWCAGKKFSDHPVPIFITISQENRMRPRRAGIMVDHLPNVIGWTWGDQTFAPGGQDWTGADDPCCAIGKTWAEIGRLNAPIRLECNRWLEGGRRIEGWLPDLPTTHHFEFEPCGPPSFEIKRPCVVLHLAGWPDGTHQLWVSACDLFRQFAHVYIVGGSYDRRPRAVYNSAARGDGRVTLVEDTDWATVVGLLEACSYCLGHASGFTAVADVLRVKGAVLNPAYVPKLVNTWNSPDNPDLVYAADEREFAAAVQAAAAVLSDGDRSVWPPSSPRGGRPVAEVPGPSAAVQAAAKLVRPRSAAVWSLDPAHDRDLAAAVVAGAYDAHALIGAVHLVGCHPDAAASARREGRRASRGPAVAESPTWPPHRGEAYELVVLAAGADPVKAADAARRAWAHVTCSGTLVVGGPAAPAAVEALGSTLGVRAGTVGNAEGWFYVHRRS